MYNTILAQPAVGMIGIAMTRLSLDWTKNVSLIGIGSLFTLESL
jgi:hypothetical protein